MDEGYLLTFAQNTLLIAVILAAPVLIVTLVVGSLVSLFQAATQVNEVTLTFVPKIIGVILIMIILGGWMGRQLLTYTINIYNDLPNLVH